MNPEFERCLRNQKIKVFSRGKTLADKEKVWIIMINGPKQG